jgi:hypothetical protein
MMTELRDDFLEVLFFKVVVTVLQELDESHDSLGVEPAMQPSLSSVSVRNTSLRSLLFEMKPRMSPFSDNSDAVLSLRGLSSWCC